MSIKNEQTKKLEEEVVVEVNETTDLELEVEGKKAKVIRLAKKAGKIAGIVGSGIVVAYVIKRVFGSKSSINTDCDVSELVDVVLEDK